MSDLSLILEALAQQCLKHSLRLATAESCTGGGVAYAITSIAGSSHWFDRAFVTYSNEAKIEMLQVSAKTIESAGAVSMEVAKQMAQGAVKFSHADLSVAITGIAGPEGGTIEKPIGTVWFAWAGREFETISEKMVFDGNRATVRSNAILFAAEYWLHLIQQKFGN